MSATKKPTTGRAIVDEVFGRNMTHHIWTADYEKALPISVQDFDLSAVLPAVFYMFRRGLRRGKGKFLETFGAKYLFSVGVDPVPDLDSGRLPDDLRKEFADQGLPLSTPTVAIEEKGNRWKVQDGPNGFVLAMEEKALTIYAAATGNPKDRKKAATIERVARTLARNKKFEGFGGEPGEAILGDMLLTFCLENAKRALGRKEQVQRVAPAHYMAGWVDLPESVAHLRFVPEMIVAMLADQKGEYIQQNREGDKTWFAVGKGFEDNVLLRAFHQGVTPADELGGLSSPGSDRFEEGALVGLDQLLMIRLAQELGTAPDKLRGGEGEKISNQRPVAEEATRHFSEDIRHFVRSYAGVVPRHAFVELLESCMGVGMTTIFTNVIEILFEWAVEGEVRRNSEQKPAFLFVDCSNGVDRRLRALAEQSMDDFMRRVERFPVILMALRLLDWGARHDRKIKALDIQTRPYATDWLKMLGELLHNRRSEAQPILYNLEQKAEELADRLEVDYPESAQILRNTAIQSSPVWRLAEALTSLQGRGNTQANLVKLLDSVLLIGRPNGLALKRTATRSPLATGARMRREIRSFVLTDSVLDYLVHLHLLRRGNKRGFRPLPFRDFVQILKDRYGFCLDTAPPGMTVSNDLLGANRVILERRLRDLGLLVGVNDAEAMKHLRPRFEPPKEE